jgi:hypothetical protein
MANHATTTGGRRRTTGNGSAAPLNAGFASMIVLLSLLSGVMQGSVVTVVTAFTHPHQQHIIQPSRVLFSSASTARHTTSLLTRIRQHDRDGSGSGWESSQSNHHYFVKKSCPQSSWRLSAASISETEGTKDDKSTSSSSDDKNDNVLTMALTQDSNNVDVDGKEIVSAIKAFTDLVAGHEMLKILGIELKIKGHTYSDSSDDKISTIEALDEVDLVCFENDAAIQEWLIRHDATMGIEDVDDDEEDEDENSDNDNEEAEEDAATKAAAKAAKKAMAKGTVEPVAVCKSTEVANTCLQSKRWEQHRIYYPSGYVIPEGSENSDEAIEKWADSAMQALGDSMERRFWGGGW